MQAYDELLCGEFSASSRVTTILSIVSHYQVNIRHIAGVANLPSDYASRHPSTCPELTCQVCRLVSETEDSVVRGLTVQEVTDGASCMPFTSRTAWHATQQDCPDLECIHLRLFQGTKPSKKITKAMDVKRYLKSVTIASDGLLVVRDDLPFQPTRECIVMPCRVLEGLLTAIHIRFSHPTQYQIKQLISR